MNNIHFPYISHISNDTYGGIFMFQFNQMFEVKEAHVLEKLVLDFDPKEKMELLSVDKSLVSKMKPHQVSNCLIIQENNCNYIPCKLVLMKSKLYSVNIAPCHSLIFQIQIILIHYGGVGKNKYKN